jgi:hypothetical protein
LKDATFMLLTESGDYPAVTALARTAYERIVNGEHVDYLLLDELIGEASGKGVLRAVRAKHGPVAFEAIFGPILTELGQRKPVPPRQAARDVDPEQDPLLASTWPPRPTQTEVAGS